MEMLPRRTVLRGLTLGAVAVACGATTDGPEAAPTSRSPAGGTGSPSRRPAAPSPTTAPSPSASPSALPSPEASPEPSAEPTPEPSTEPSPESPPEAEPSPEATVQAASVAVICRDAWGAKATTDGFVAHRIQRLTVHHTAVVLGSNTKAPARLRQHQTHHQNQGWPDIAYHLGVDRNGHVYDLRPREFRGDTFTEYDPTGHFLVLAEGDFNKETISDAQLTSVARVLAWGAVAFDVDPATLGGHRDYAATSCPGADFYRHVADGSLRRRVEQQVAAGITLDVRCDDATFARVADIEAGRA